MRDHPMFAKVSIRCSVVSFQLSEWSQKNRKYKKEDENGSDIFFPARDRRGGWSAYSSASHIITLMYELQRAVSQRGSSTPAGRPPPYHRRQ